VSYAVLLATERMVKENSLRTTITGVLLLIILLQGCATPGEKDDPKEGATVADTPVAYVPQEGLSSQQRFREALNLLEDGQPLAARGELILYLEQKPGSDTGADLLQQIDLPALDYFPEDYREVQLAPGQSLSTLARQYLGSIYQFYALAKYNGIAVPHSLRVGQTIRIPLTTEARSAFAAQDSAVKTTTPGAITPNVAVDAPKDDTTEPVTEKPVLQSEPQPEDTPAADVATLHREALDAYRAQDLNRAIELWDQVLIIDPDHENARLYRAQAVELQVKLRSLN
jgi:hypothetical protein